MTLNPNVISVFVKVQTVTKCAAIHQNTTSIEIQQLLTYKLYHTNNLIYSTNNLFKACTQNNNSQQFQIHSQQKKTLKIFD